MAETGRTPRRDGLPPAGRAPAPLTAGTAPGGLPLLGHALPMQRRPLEFLSSLSARGDLVEIRLGPRRVHLICHPELALRVLTDARTFDKGGPLFDKVRPLVGNGLFTSGWDDHRVQRRLVQPAFHHARLAAYADVMCEEIESTIGAWEEGRAVDLGPALHALTVRVTTRTLFSTTADDRAVRDVQRFLPVILHGVYRRMVAPIGLVERLPTPGNRRFEEARTRLRRIIDGTVRSRRADGTDHGDLLSLLIGAQDEESGRSFTDEDVRDQVMTLLIAGTETTASALGWAFHLLGTHREAGRLVEQEADRVLGARPARFGDLAELDFTRRVVTEALRLYPPAWLLTRMATVETELAGRRLAPGTTLLFSPYVLGRRGDCFPDPERFDPDRWLPERAAAVPRGAMLPFGAGNRKCVGDAFGMAEATLAVASVASRWRLRHAPGTTVRPSPKAGLGTGPLLMVPERRRLDRVPRPRRT